MRILFATGMLLAFSMLLQGCITLASSPASPSKSSTFRQVNFQDLIDRYMQKSEANSIEGVYSVSGMVIKKSKNLIGEMKEKTTDRKENYATVAILREKDNGDYIELSLNRKELTSYSIIGEFKKASGNLLVYRHFDPKGKEDATFTFTADEKGELLEGIRVEDEGGKQLTYKLTYVKLKPH